MRILALNSSYRRNGNTARIVEMMGDHLKVLAAQNGEPLEFEPLNLGHADLQLCRGCRTCFDRGEDKCPLRDDLLMIKAKIDAADAVILAGPVYVNDINGIAKNWMDRLAFVCHRPAFAGKCAYLVATVGDSPTNHALRTMEVGLRTWGFHIVGKAGYKMGALMSEDDARRRYGERTAKAAEVLFRAVAQRRAERPSFLSLMTFKIQQIAWRRVADPTSLDYRYWHEQGWLDARREFYIPHQANRAKVALARLAGSVLARFVT